MSASLRAWLLIVIAAALSRDIHAEEAASFSDTHELLDSVMWVQTSAEYIIGARQAFNAAAEKLDLALRDKLWTACPKQFDEGKYQDLPPAVVVNLDETIISNAPYLGRVISQHAQLEWSTYEPWAKEAKSPAVPGAKKFLEHASQRDVAIIYNTTRPDSLRDATLRNLKWLEYPYDPDKDELIMGRDWASAIEKHRILVVVGDTLSDFLLDSHKDPTQRRELAARYADYWGLKWFIVPNPMIGQWEDSLNGFKYDADRAARIHTKLQALKTEPDAQPKSDE